MNTIKNILIATSFLVLTSCATTATFPVSSIVPAANIKATKKIDNNNNIILEITAENLASPTRLKPSGKIYNVWIVSKEHGVKNVGQLRIRNASKARLKTVTPFSFEELFITVENQGDLKYPTGAEVARTSFK